MARVSHHRWMKSFGKLFSVQFGYLKCTGLWRIDGEYPRLLRSLHHVYGVWIVITMYIFAITVFADMSANMDNLSITTDDGCIFAGIAVVIFKAMNYQLRQEKIARLLGRVQKCADDLCQFSEVDCMEDIVNRYRIQSTVTFYGFSVLGFVLGIALLFCSPMQNGLPIRAKYPFDTSASPWNEIALTVETLAVFSGLVAIVAMDSIMILMCSLLTMLFEILSVNYEHCQAEENAEEFYKSYSKKSIQPTAMNRNDRFLYRYKRCLRYHQQLVSMTTSFNRIYNTSMFVQLLSSTSMICLTGFQAVVVGGQSSDILKFVIYLNAAISQLFYNCWIGNELSHACSVSDRSQWLSGWHRERLADIVQTFTLSTMFARQPVKLKAGVFYVLSLETFIVIIKRSYSVYTLLNNMHTANP